MMDVVVWCSEVASVDDLDTENPAVYAGVGLLCPHSLSD